MRLWGALAVQILAVLLRDQNRKGIPESTIVVPECDCQCSCEAPEVSPRFLGIACVGTLVVFGTGLLLGIRFSKAVVPGDGRSEFGGGRRRGGGVLSQSD